MISSDKHILHSDHGCLRDPRVLNTRQLKDTYFFDMVCNMRDDIHAIHVFFIFQRITKHSVLLQKI